MSNNVWVDFVIPIASAVLGGLVTMIGVIITIRWERKKEEQARKDAAKPWIYSLNERKQARYEESNKIHLTKEGEPFSADKGKGIIIIKNASDAIGIVKKFQTENQKRINGKFVLFAGIE